MHKPVFSPDMNGWVVKGDREYEVVTPDRQNVSSVSIKIIGNKGAVAASARGILDLEKAFAHKIEGYGSMIEEAGEFLVLYEIRFTETVLCFQRIF